jgi:PAS domain-containing protein
MNNTLAQALTARAATARRRLAAFEGRQVTGAHPSADGMKAAMREVSDLLEELRVATEQLYAASDDLALARREAIANAERYRELHEGLPLPCILTNESGDVDEANTLAATLLNVARPYLAGKPLLLFLPEREQYFGMLDRVRTEGSAGERLMVRPRDRRPRQVRIDVTALPHQLRWCWVFSELA